MSFERRLDIPEHLIDDVLPPELALRLEERKGGSRLDNLGRLLLVKLLLLTGCSFGQTMEPAVATPTPYTPPNPPTEVVLPIPTIDPSEWVKADPLNGCIYGNGEDKRQFDGVGPRSNRCPLDPQKAGLPEYFKLTVPDPVTAPTLEPLEQ